MGAVIARRGDRTLGRRLVALRGPGAAPASTPGATVRALVASLAIPGELDAQVRLAAALVVGAPTAALVAAGPVLAVVVLAVVLVAAVAARRGAPARRAAADERALPGVLEAIARQLRAGGSLQQAIAAVEVDADPRCSSLPATWSRLADLAPVVGVAAALDAWAADAPDTPSVQLATAALAMANDTGGSPARAVDGVASTLRSRLAVADEVRALSSQARASAAVIALAPLAFGAAAGLTDARTAAFFTTPVGLTLLVTGLALDGAGAWWMGRLCRLAAA